MEKIMEGNGPECHTHHIIKRYVKKLRLMVIFCLNVPGGNVAVSQKTSRVQLAKRAAELLFIEVNL